MISKIALAAILTLPPLASEAEATMAPSKLEVTLDSSGAVATGVTPGGTVAWLGASRSRTDWSDHFARWRHTVEDTDKDGTVSLPRKGGFPWETVLVVVDVTTGAFAVGATWKIEKEIPAPAFAGARFDAAGLLGAFTEQGSEVDLLVVRPGSAAFAARVVDGGSLDEDGTANGIVTVSFPSLPARAGKADRLDGLRPGDTVVRVDPKVPSVQVGRYSGNPGKE